MNLSDYDFSNQTPTWCSGCGNFAALLAVKKALLNLNVAPKNAVVVYDIGCGGNMINFLQVCGFAGLHGRSIPVAIGVKQANPKLTVIAQGGDGGLLNEGTNHLVHAARRNDDITVLLFNNFVFALTAGQTSSSTPKGVKTKSTPKGNLYPPLNSLLLAASSGAGFLARVLPSNLNETTKIITEAIKHKGFSLVEMLLPCLIWGEENYSDFLKNNVFYPEKLPQEKNQILNFLAEKKNNLALGILWQENQ